MASTALKEIGDAWNSSRDIDVRHTLKFKWNFDGERERYAKFMNANFDKSLKYLSRMSSPIGIKAKKDMDDARDAYNDLFNTFRPRTMALMTPFATKLETIYMVLRRFVNECGFF